MPRLQQIGLKNTEGGCDVGIKRDCIFTFFQGAKNLYQCGFFESSPTLVGYETDLDFAIFVNVISISV